MKHYLVLAVLAAMAAIAFGFGPAPEPETRPAASAPAVQKPPAPPNAAEAFCRELPKCDFEDARLADVLAWLGEVTKTNISPNWNALAAAGISKDLHITLHLKDVTAEKALREAIDFAGGARTAIDFRFTGNVVVISTREDFNQYTFVQTYNIRAILDDYRAWRCVRSDHEGYDVGCEQVLSLVRGMADPESWKPEGTVGTAIDVRHYMVVVQTPHAHRQIEQLLAALTPNWASEMEQKLERPLRGVKLDDVAWPDALHEIHRATGLNVVAAPAVLARKLPHVHLLTDNLTAEQTIGLLAKLADAKWYVVDGVVYFDAHIVPPRPKPAPKDAQAQSGL